MLFAQGTTTLGFASDHVQVQWYPSGFYIMEQGESASSLYLILSGEVDIFHEEPVGQLNHLNRRGPGTFIGEEGLAFKQSRNAYVVAVDHVTCLMLTPGKPTSFSGRGAEASLTESGPVFDQELDATATTVIDVSEYIKHKITALAEHRTQYPIEPTMLPQSLLQEILGREYFVRVHPPREFENELFVNI